MKPIARLFTAESENPRTLEGLEDFRGQKKFLIFDAE